jgi:polyphosphate kinase
LQAGKEVVVFVEVKARFDEEANLSWAEKLESWGAKVLYSLPEIKVHAKLAMITRLEAGEPRKYCYLSTGNFNENTALIYGDFGFFTADPRITEEVGQIFDFLQTNGSSQLKPKHLLVGQDRLRKEIWKRIDAEIAAAKSGKPAEILLKMNSLQDQRMIHRLYQASMAGVKVKIIVRGICCLVPQLPIYSENIEVISIVDRFLEHTRIYIFHNEGRPEMFLSSADWMTRNLYHRIECAFPIYDESLQQEIFQVLKMQWQDNVKARIISPTANNTYKPRAANEPPIRSQIETYNFYKKGSMYNS